MSLARFSMIYGIGFMLAATSPFEALADEQMTPLAAAGDWVAASHHASSLAAPDMCLAAVQSGQFALRADDNDIEFRMVNKEWSLPADVKGQIVITISGKDTTLDIGGNTAVSIAAEISRDDAIRILDSMAKASSMLVKAGKDKPLTVSLSGSNKVLSAFRTCARLQGTSGGGLNPF